jgi:hypothetical protein
MYAITASEGRKYLFSEDRETLAGYTEFGDGVAHSDDFSTVATRRLERSEGIAFGRGNSNNPDRAEAYFYFDARGDDGGDADTDPDPLEGEYKIVVLNAANNVVGLVDRGRLEEVRQGDPLDPNSKRGEWGKPFKYRSLRNGSGEIVGGNGHKLGIQIKLDPAADGTTVSDGFVVANSAMIAEGYKGSLVN